ncbi:pyridoxal phosphate-dependent aminotransferase [Psychrobacillus psychrodurans]|uniref:pyridoxal phosphate-dependent aminotransferase n=1 Tax=Psychrobacillus psychrodurans TaxID=126157 RepID=UPI0008E825C4|nr:histidinol-phosphate transaminase [Psychrobacillus psychrodurans]MCZ8538944.1 histidinol-phosphate aminotransferase family protein [Psychrobacillus psychrodurans]SFM25414.1 threonine-phosphate decarboxylase [Psychrobacillus psychrodurans]
MALPNHGANAHHVYERLGIEMPETVIDYSENVNPLGVPTFVNEKWSTYAQLITKYPDPQGEPFLSAAAKYHGISVENTVVGNGAAEIFASLAKRYENKRAVLIHPTFSEYEATLAPYNVYIKEIIATGKLPLDEVLDEVEFAEVIYICRPNNPTGYLIPLEEIIQIAKYAMRYKCEVILDEAFIDFIDEKESFIPYLKEFPNVIVVRSMTKMYAIPGIRLGYALANKSIVNDIRSRMPHWNSNAIATTIGAECLLEEDYRMRAIAFAKEMREQMTEFLVKWNCIVLPSATNFLCFQLPDSSRSKEFFASLLAKGCVLRHTENFKGLDGKWFRVGMKEISQMEHLQKEMTAWFVENLSS